MKENDYLKMIYSDKLYSLFIENNIEEPEDEEEEEDIQTGEIWVAKKMYPNRHVWERVGFNFLDNQTSGLYIKAGLPEGWYAKVGDNAIYTYFYDKDGNVRGRMITVHKIGDVDVRMELYCRYEVRHATEDYKTAEIYFGNPTEKLFIAGTCPDALISPEIERLKALATQFAEENYPDYKFPGAYWEKEATRQLKPGKKEDDK